MLAFQFGDVLEVHAVDTHDEGERHKDDREYRQRFHDLVHALEVVGADDRELAIIRE